MSEPAKLVLITGASSGVGAAAAREFARHGSRVGLVARSAGALAELSEEIGENATALPCDAADAEQVSALSEQVLAEIGLPDVIVHCAGAGQWKTVQDTTPEEAVSMMQAPYLAAFNVTQAFLPGMLARGSGVLIHVNSPAAVMAWPSSAGYTAARAALMGFHEALSQDLVGTGVHSCHVIFGRIDSEYFVKNPGVAEKMPTLSRTIPTLSPGDCARKLLKIAQSPRHSTIHPFVLRAYCLTARLLPGLTRWMLRF